MRRLYRLPIVTLIVIGGLISVSVIFPLIDQRKRYWMMRHWSRMVLWACGVRMHIEGPMPLATHQGGGMVACNHISWMDIFVINAINPASFVAKADIAAWPVVGTLVARGGTLFIERGKRHAVHQMIERISQHVQAGWLVAVFPEGTTSDGRRILPFHANLLEAAVRAKAPLLPMGVRYTDAQGRHDPATEYIGSTTFVDSLLQVTARPCVIARVVGLDPIAVDETTRRHDLSSAARARISEALGLPLEDTLPEVLRGLRAERQ
jgi:1-acyl-sn-glycerol-3-phosphate acyltransferase